MSGLSEGVPLSTITDLVKKDGELYVKRELYNGFDCKERNNDVTTEMKCNSCTFAHVELGVTVYVYTLCQGDNAFLKSIVMMILFILVLI